MRPEYRYNQYGAALGGPVNLPKLYHGKNRTFFFVNWEQYKYVTYGDSITSTPPPSQRTGNFSQPVHGHRTVDSDLRPCHHRREP